LAAAAQQCATVLASLALAAGLPAAAAAHRQSGCPGAGLRPTATNVRSIGAATLCLVNDVRAAWRLGPVRANGELRWLAAKQVRDMVHHDYFADVRPDGLTPMAVLGATSYRSHAARVSVAQNIAWGTGTAATPAAIVAAWMASPPHRRVILTGSFRDAGVYTVPAVPARLAQGYGATYAIEFGTRR
jgi:uncharacterized protein YkwD